MNVKGDMKGQAQEIWAMLDDMATNDPQAYKKFIDKQMKEGKETMQPPQPHMCVVTKILSGNNHKYLVVNIFEHNRVPAPKSDEDPIPVMGGRLYRPTAATDGDDELCVCVVFNPGVLERFGIDSTLMQEQQLLINLALDYVEDMHKVKVNRGYSLLPKSVRCKGDVVDAQRSLKSKDDTEDLLEQNLEELQESLGPRGAGLTQTILTELGNMGSTTEDKPHVLPKGKSQTNKDIIIPHTEKPPAQKGLIQEMTSDGQSTGRCLLTPDHTLTHRAADSAQPERYVLRVELPGVTSVADCELDVTQDEVRLVVEDEYELKVSLERHVDNTEAKAKFSKRSSSLTVTMPVITN